MKSDERKTGRLRSALIVLLLVSLALMCSRRCEAGGEAWESRPCAWRRSIQRIRTHRGA